MAASDKLLILSISILAFDKILAPFSALFPSSLTTTGIFTSTSLIAEGIIAAIKEEDISIPVVVRLEGNNAEKGAKILSKANIKIESINNLSDAAKKVVELAK